LEEKVPNKINQTQGESPIFKKTTAAEEKKATSNIMSFLFVI